jgi:hypothetical protein
MNLDERADVFAILGLAGAGAGLMLVGSLDLRGAAIVLAVVLPALVAIVAATVVAVNAWYQARRAAHSHPSGFHQAGFHQGYRPARYEQQSSALRAARESHKESL